MGAFSLIHLIIGKMFNLCAHTYPHWILYLPTWVKSCRTIVPEFFHPTIIIDSTQLCWVSSITFLGVISDENLKWKSAVNHVSQHNFYWQLLMHWKHMGMLSTLFRNYFTEACYWGMWMTPDDDEFSAWNQIHRRRDEWGGFSLPSSQTIKGEQI